MVPTARLVTEETEGVDQKALLARIGQLLSMNVARDTPAQLEQYAGTLTLASIV